MSNVRAFVLILSGALAIAPCTVVAQSPGATGTDERREAPARPQPVQHQAFPTPEAGFAAMADAARAHDERRLIRILGEEARPLIQSGDPAADRAAQDRFANAYAEKAEVLFPAPDRAVLEVGNDEWPLPIPMLRHGQSWRFHPRQGVQEMVDRRIGRNELDTIQVLRAIVAAQDEYARTEGRQGAFRVYARRFFSTPGTHDGLYWAAQEDEPDSPLGPLVAAAAAGGTARSRDDRPTPFHGYIFRMLEKQGPDAPGGEIDYIVNGRMIGGFGVIATPAQYGVSGVQTFIVSHTGTVCQRNLGPNTARIAATITAYDPGPEWEKVTDTGTAECRGMAG